MFFEVLFYISLILHFKVGILNTYIQITVNKKSRDLYIFCEIDNNY